MIKKRLTYFIVAIAYTFVYGFGGTTYALRQTVPSESQLRRMGIYFVGPEGNNLACDPSNSASNAPGVTANLPTREKLAQLLMPRIESQADMDAAQAAKVGGIFVPNNKIVDLKDSIKKFSDSYPTIKPHIAVDAEGGSIAPKNVNNTPINARDLANSQDLTQAQLTYSNYAKSLAELGVTMNLAPVVDVVQNSDLNAGGIGKRSYSSDPDTVTSYAKVFVQALSSNGIYPVIKHFPGHGQAKNSGGKIANTDRETAYTPALETVLSRDILPYQQLVNQEKMGVMISNLRVTGVDTRVPAAFSQSVISNMLRKDLDFNGLVITDDLNAQAIKDVQPDIVEAIIASIVAGSDIALFSTTDVSGTITRALDTMEKAVESGRITQDRLNSALASTENTKKASAASGKLNLEVNGLDMDPRWVEVLAAAGQRYNIDPGILAALLHVESRGWKKWGDSSNIVNKGSGATGYFQMLHTGNGSGYAVWDTYKVDGDNNGVIEFSPWDTAFAAANMLDQSIIPKDQRQISNTDEYIGGLDQPQDFQRRRAERPFTVASALARYNQGPAAYRENGQWSGKAWEQVIEYINLGTEKYREFIGAVDTTKLGSGAGCITTSQVRSVGTQEYETVTINGKSYQKLIKIDGVYYYSQRTLGGYGSSPYGNGTIAACGCGPTSMAMIISTLTGTPVLPPEVAKYASENGYQEPSCGSYAGALAKGFADKYNLTYEVIGEHGQNGMTDAEMARAKEITNAGGLILVSTVGPNSYTSGNGHLMVLRGFTPSGEVLINDPNDGSPTDGERYLSVTKAAWPLDYAQQNLRRMYALTK